MRRRDVVTGAPAVFALLALSRTSWAQRRRPRIGFMVTFHPSPNALLFLRRLAELGLEDGRTVEVDMRSPQGRVDRFSAVAAELLSRKPDVVVAIGPEEAGRVGLEIAKAVPVVILAPDYDPVEKGLVKSYHRPGGNLTGVYFPQRTLAVKRLEILRRMLPELRRLAVFGDALTRDQLDALRRAQGSRDLALHVIEFARLPYDFASSFESVRKFRADAVFILNSPAFLAHAKSLVALALSSKLPAMYGNTDIPDVGGLIAYSASVPQGFARVAEMAVRVLKGTRPADMPVEQPTMYELVVNLKSAKAIGLAIPQTVLLQADRVIE